MPLFPLPIIFFSAFPQPQLLLPHSIFFLFSAEPSSSQIILWSKGVQLCWCLCVEIDPSHHLTNKWLPGFLCQVWGPSYLLIWLILMARAWLNPALYYFACLHDHNLIFMLHERLDNSTTYWFTFYVFLFCFSVLYSFLFLFVYWVLVRIAYG